MKQLLFALLFIPALLFAQEDQHYLAGAVPVADGKVVFTREINAPSLSKALISRVKTTLPTKGRPSCSTIEEKGNREVPRRYFGIKKALE